MAQNIEKKKYGSYSICFHNCFSVKLQLMVNKEKPFVHCNQLELNTCLNPLDCKFTLKLNKEINVYAVTLKLDFFPFQDANLCQDTDRKNHHP